LSAAQWVNTAQGDKMCCTNFGKKALQFILGDFVTNAFCPRWAAFYWCRSLCVCWLSAFNCLKLFLIVWNWPTRSQNRLQNQKFRICRQWN
jgi:hypothetical protein